jgi:hypothetical protein
MNEWTYAYPISAMCDDCGKHNAIWATRFSKDSEEIWFFCDRCNPKEVKE